MFTRIFPILNWIRIYRLEFIRWDVIAGITLAAYVLPESMAYSALADLPSEIGIYCCVAGCLAYALFTQSRQVAVGPTSSISLMVGSTVAVLSGGDMERWAAIASLAAFGVAALSLIAYLLKVSSLVNFISENILLGFKAGAALSIAMTQLPKLLGVHGGSGNFFEKAWYLATHLSEARMMILGFGIIVFILLFAGNRFFPGRPITLIVVAAAISVVTIWPDRFNQLHFIDKIPPGLPHLVRPAVRFEDVENILGLCMGCFLMGYIETVAASRTFAEKNNYVVDARQELLSLSAANFAVSMAGGYPISGGMSQSSVNDKAGAKTPMALIVCSITLALLLTYFTGLLQNLPEVVLAVIVIDAILGLIKVKQLRKIYSLSKSEFYISMVAIAGVLTFGILQGVLIAAIVSIGYIIARSSSPGVVLLGRVPNTLQYSDIERHHHNETFPGIAIIRIEASVFYYNDQFVYFHVMRLANQVADLRLVVLDMSSTPAVDVSGSQMLVKLQHELGLKGITLKLVNALADVRELLRKQGIEESVGHISRKISIEDVVIGFLEKKNESLK